MTKAGWVLDVDAVCAAMPALAADDRRALADWSARCGVYIGAAPPADWPDDRAPLAVRARPPAPTWWRGVSSGLRARCEAAGGPAWAPSSVNERRLYWFVLTAGADSALEALEIPGDLTHIGRLLGVHRDRLRGARDALVTQGLLAVRRGDRHLNLRLGAELAPAGDVRRVVPPSADGAAVPVARPPVSSPPLTPLQTAATDAYHEVDLRGTIIRVPEGLAYAITRSPTGTLRLTVLPAPRSD